MTGSRGVVVEIDGPNRTESSRARRRLAERSSTLGKMETIERNQVCGRRRLRWPKPSVDGGQARMFTSGRSTMRMAVVVG
ncbi:hypothetical protein M6B38_120820 [Iris pallida]|uniref:Uncharacterized protein n=1 Tax=Iris pallida TaxID=29817 RepID=A0AAX6HAM0_IRIPA|nr:hypothetical protein M6B38_120820 [Iris pallida]